MTPKSTGNTEAEVDTSNIYPVQGVQGEASGQCPDEPPTVINVQIERHPDPQEQHAEPLPSQEGEEVNSAEKEAGEQAVGEGQAVEDGDKEEQAGQEVEEREEEEEEEVYNEEVSSCALRNEQHCVKLVLR